MPRRRKGSVVISGDQPLHSPTDGATWGWGAKGYGKPGRPYAEAWPTNPYQNPHGCGS